MKFILTYALLVFALCLHAGPSHEVDSLLYELDQVLLNSNEYMMQKENRIDRLKNSLRQEVSTEKKYELGYSIIEEYKSYRSDSAFIYIDINKELATQEKNPIWLVRTKLQYAFVLSSSGLFVEATQTLHSIPTDKLSNELLVEYYIQVKQLNDNLSAYIATPPFSEIYNVRSEAARDSILVYLPKESPSRIYFEYLKAYSENDLEQAEKYMRTYLQSLHPSTHEYAKRSHELGWFYHHINDEEKQVKHLIYAVMADIKDAVKENLAMLNLSIWLYDHGDIHRAYNYIQFALDDANFYNARFRHFLLSKELPIIINAYRQSEKEQNNHLKLMLSVISLLSIFLLIVLFILQRQKKVLATTKQGLDQTNSDLEEMNRRLNILNQELTDANLIKEEYISHFIDLYSEYINKLDDFRKMINNKIAAKRFDELHKLTSSTHSLMNDEIKEFYAHFDKAFLNIYPGFVSSFNKMLKKEERFDIKRGELLNTELRVFALIRLGITDSAKIASFLRCSVQTVYNYRSKMKKRGLDENEDIEEKIRLIGSLPE